MYKADKGISAKKKDISKDAAKTVTTRSSKGQPDTEATGMIKESEVNSMSAQEYEKKADIIMEAIRSGKFIYDLSGNAR